MASFLTYVLLTAVKPEPIEINQLKIPTDKKYCYRYPGIDENISYNGMLNKEKVTWEYLNRVRKIWSSEYSDYNKVIAYNSFAIPVITPTVGIIYWTIDEKPKSLNKKYTAEKTKEQEKNYINRKMYGYFQKKLH